MWDWHVYGGGMMWFFWIPVILLIVWLVMSSTGRSSLPGKTRSPEDILKERYARGEIDQAEFREKLDDLRSVDDRSE